MENVLDLIVVGAGPAGCSAAIYAKSRGLNLLVIEKKQVGGIIANVSTVTHYSGIMEEETGTIFKNRLINQLKNSNIEVLYDEVIGMDLDTNIKKITTKNNTYYAKAIILANGSTPRSLDIPCDNLVGKGYQLNALRDGLNYKGKNIYVVGGADGAIKEALYLSKFANELTIIHFEDQLGCINEFKEKIKDVKNIKLALHSRLVKVEGSECVENLYIKDEHTNEVKKICDKGCGIFVYAGLVPNTSLCKNLELKDNCIVVNNKMETSINGVYAVGDITYKQVKQVATAVNDGAIAAVNASIYIKNLK